MPNRILQRLAPLAVLAWGVVIAGIAAAAPYYSVGVNGLVPVPGGVGYQDMVMNGPKTMCLPNGGPVCGPLAVTAGNGQHGSVEARVDLQDSFSLYGQSRSVADGWAWMEIGSSLVGNNPGIVEAVLHLSYMWRQEPGAGFLLTYLAGDMAHNFHNGALHSGSLGPSGSGTLDLAMPLGVGGGLQIMLQMTVNSRGAIDQYPNAEVEARVSWWLELPGGVALADGTVGVPLNAPEAIPAPGGAALLAAATALLAARRRKTQDGSRAG